MKVKTYNMSVKRSTKRKFCPEELETLSRAVSCLNLYAGSGSGTGRASDV